MFLKLLEQSLTTTKQKKERYNLSLFIVDQLIMTRTGLNQGGSTTWFNLAPVIQVESKKPTGFILPTIDIEFTRPIFPEIRKPFWATHQVHRAFFSYCHTKPNKTALPVIYIKLAAYKQMVQIQPRYICLFRTQLRSHLRVYKKYFNPHFLFQSQKRGWVSQKFIIEQLI